MANLDYASNNSVAVGDVYRGRAQEKFLAGWKKGGVTAAEEIDPSWLVNSMDADSDCGRRVSTACLSRSYHSDIESSVVSNASDQNKHRRRRVGQVSLPGEFPGYGVPRNTSPTAKSRHTICTPPDFTVMIPNTGITDAGHQQRPHHHHPHHHNTDQAHHFIPDDSLQAKQLRLLDRKISMYFGERTSNSSSARSTPIRRTRSFDRILGFDGSENNINIFSSHPSNQSGPHEIITGSNEPSGSETVRSSATLSMNVGIGIGDDPHFSCAASNSGVSDIETDSCDFHVSPPVEVIPTKVPTDEGTSQNQQEMTTATSPILQRPETATTSSTSNVCRFPMEVKYEGSATSSGGGIDKNPVMSLDAEIESVDNKNPSLDDFLCFDDPKTSDSTSSGGGNKNECGDEDSFEDKGSGLDDESLWNRTEALMSSYQSFNLIRKSTIDPK